MSAYPYKWKVLTFIFNAYALWLGQFTSQIKSLSKRRKERKMPDDSIKGELLIRQRVLQNTSYIK